jgi:hypothetical protein
MSMESHSGMILTEETEELEEKPLPILFYPPQIQHGQTQARTRASAVRSRRLSTWGYYILTPTDRF